MDRLKLREMLKKDAPSVWIKLHPILPENSTLLNKNYSDIDRPLVTPNIKDHNEIPIQKKLI